MKQKQMIYWVLSITVLLWGMPSALAESSRFFDVETFSDFLEGNPETTAISDQGEISLPPTVRERFADVSAVFSAATSRRNDVVVARADDGTVLAIDRAGKSRVLYKAEDTIITALLSTPEGLYVALASPAKIIRVDGKGRAKVFHTPDASFVWDMVRGPHNTILAACGAPGVVLQIDAKGNGTVLFQPEQTHLRSICFDPGLGTFVGGGERGILYRAADNKDFRALFDTQHVEVTGIAVKDNYVFCAGVTGAEALASESADDEGGGKGKSNVEVRSQLVRIGMDGTADVLAGSNDEAIFDLAIDDYGRVLVATGATGRDDPRGRLYTVDPKGHEIAMIYQSPSRRITHLVPLPRSAIAAVAGAGGRIIHLTGGVARVGEYFSVPFDTGTSSRFGNVEIFGTFPKGTRVTAAARSGQTAKPDPTWSDWSKEIHAPGNRHTAVPRGRFVQLRLTLRGNGHDTPAVHRVRLSYLRQNLPPFVREVVALHKGLALFPVTSDPSKSKTISLNDKPGKKTKKNGNSKSKDKSRARQIEQSGALTLKWLADDPNGDDLTYDLSFRALGHTEWHTMDTDLDQPFYTIHSSQLPDGHYEFRVRATDAPSNPAGLELNDTRHSRTILVDNTPPTVDPPKVSIVGRRVTIRTVVADAVGPLTKAEYSLDTQDFRPMMPDDGVLDGPGESFNLRLGVLSAGPHSLTIRVIDDAENEGFGEARFSVP